MSPLWIKKIDLKRKHVEQENGGGDRCRSDY